MSDVRVMIVEDEGIVAMDIENTLRSLGYNVVCVESSGESALKKIVESNPDIILMDIMLKGELDGIETYSKIKENYDIPVVYLTAFGDSSTLSRAKLTEPYGYILKPFEENEIYISIEMALYKFKMQQKIKNSEAKYRNIVESLDAGIITTDVNKVVVDLNKSGAKILGIGNKDAVDKPILDIFNIVDNEIRLLIDGPLSSLINKENEEVGFTESKFLLDNGDEIKMLYKVQPLMEKNKIKGILIIFSA